MPNEPTAHQANATTQWPWGNTCHNDMCNDMMAVKRHVRWHGTNELSRASHRVIWNLGSDMFLAL
jgi:hypothetical protein